jgi:threonine dehydratase
MNFDRLRHISERTEIGEKREAIFAVTLPEKPGAFKAFCQALGKRNITEFNYRYADAAAAHVFVGVQLRQGSQERQEISAHLEQEGYACLDLSDDEMAKLHIRHLVGGRASLNDEYLFRFEFPERPNALMNFLSRLDARWNISLFHYRNHGAAYGRVLVGLQIGQSSHAELLASLAAVGYPYQEESNNPAYRLFLG